MKKLLFLLLIPLACHAQFGSTKYPIAINASGVLITPAPIDLSAGSMASNVPASKIIGTWDNPVISGTLTWNGGGNANMGGGLILNAHVSANSITNAGAYVGSITTNNADATMDAAYRNPPLVAVTNHLPLYAFYPNSAGTALTDAFGMGIWARPTGGGEHYPISTPAPFGFRTNITHVYFMITNSATAHANIILSQSYNGPDGALANRAANFTNTIPLSTGGLTNIMSLSFTNASASACTNMVQNIDINPNTVSGTGYFIGGIQIWLP